MKNKTMQIFKRIVTDIYDYRFALIGIAGYCIITDIIFGEYCPMVIVTGLPCPGCGMTRALLLLLTGRFSESIVMNPLALGWLLLAAYFVIVRYILNKRVKGLYLLICILMISTIIIYLYRMIAIFPDHAPPMIYNKNNILQNIFQYIKTY